jgi:3-dehydroquinate synthase
MSQPNIILTGFMGTGKSAIGRLLAEKTGRLFIDTDEIIVDQTGVTISEIFTIEGEERFRELEREISRDLEKAENAVIATGGRLMLDPINALLLSGKNLVFCLMAAPEEIVERLRDEGGRPLLAGADPKKRITQLLKAREEGYEQFQQVVTSGKSPDQVASEIMKRVKEMILEGSGLQKLTSKLVIRHPNGQYPIFVGDDLLPSLSRRLSLESSFVVITDDNVGPLYSHLIGASQPLQIITMPSGEGHKNLDTVTPIYSQLINSGLDRSGAIIALGGGVVGDMAGFLAATYMRGVKLIQCPTTLLSMIDASIGGKTGVDLAQGKNLVGAFKQPAVVLADLTTLKTLPKNEFLSGMAEVIKHGIIASPNLLERIRSSSWKSYGVNSDNQFQAMVVEAIEIKKEIVQEDPFERGIRAHLNLGHTFAHAIETVSHYRIKHGFAVSMGLVAAARLSSELGHCDPAFATSIERLLDDVGLPTRIPSEIEPGQMMEVMQRDKKRVSGRIHYVLIHAAGDVFVTSDVLQQAVADTIIGLQESENK